MEQVANNEFYRGLDTDTDVLKKRNDVMADAMDVRLFTVKGQGAVATNTNGNEFRDNLSPGFVPLGYASYNGIAYILSVNPVSGIGEAGTYPSPIDGINPGFEYKYKPLRNFTAANNPAINPIRQNFTTSLFNFDCQHQIRMIARIDYDNSVNLYFVDHKNPFRSINSGFDQTGVFNNRFFWNGSFPNLVNVFNETCTQSQVSLVSQTNNGNLEAGNWFFFFRNITQDFNKTSYTSESNAVQISPAGNGIAGIHGAAGETATDKCVTLHLTNIDTSYFAIEVSFIYYNSGVFRTGLIDKFYIIDPATGTMDITICGNEQVIDQTFEQIIQRKPTDDIPKSVAQLENRAWIANLKGRELFHPDLLAFANNAVISFDDTLLIHDEPFSLNGPVPPEGQYKDYKKTYNQTGYFSGETYAFAMVFVFTDGKESQAIPMKGTDAWTGVPNVLFDNTDGIYRFPNPAANPFRKNQNFVTGEGDLRIFGVKFDYSASVITPFMQDNVCGFYFVRGERNPNLLYQGIGVQTYDSQTVDSRNFVAVASCGPVCGAFTQGVGINFTEQKTIKRMPMLDGSFVVPYLQNCHIIAPFSDANVIFTTDTLGQSISANNFGIYSPDYFFKRNVAEGNHALFSFGGVTLTPTITAGYYPDMLFENMGITFGAGVLFNNVVNNIFEWTISDNNGFVSMYNEGSATDPAIFYYSKLTDPLGLVADNTVSNRAFATTRYMGISGSANNLDRQMTNVYQNNPDPAVFDIRNQYIVSNTNYFKISNFIDINILPPVNTVYYKGDCFLQRTYIKQLYNPDTYAIDKVDSNSCHYTFGILMGIVTENAYNTAMRYQDVTNKYYPETGLASPNDFIVNNIKRESELFNLGYNQVLSGKAFEGFDKFIPLSNNNTSTVNHPTRIRYSNFHTMNSFQDFYRVFDLNAFKDYDYRLGEITDIIDFHSRLASVQEFGVNFHFVNDRATIPTQSSSGGLLIGSGDVLAQKTQNVSDEYGSQHQWSIIKSDSGLYGVDFNKRKIWKVHHSGQFESISDTKQLYSKVHDIFDELSENSDIIQKFPDNPICNQGITGFYDRKYSNIGFTVLYNHSVQQEKPYSNSRTVVFNEDLDRFETEQNYKSGFYMTINNDFFSFKPDTLPSQTNNPVLYQGSFYQHDIETTALGVPNRQTWYDVLYPWFIKFIVNNYSDHPKIFDFMQLASSPELFSQIIYRTENQEAIQNPFDDPLLNRQIRPKHIENIWKFPVTRATSVIPSPNNIYNLKSTMRGKFMEVYLEYFSNKPMFIKSATTMAKISKQ